jgi:peptidylprolyl isomerase
VSESAAGFPAVTGNAGEAPTITPPTGAAPTTLQTKDIIVGTGTEVLPTSTLTVHYTLMTWSNGKLIESSWSGGQPATFPLSGVIAGWQEGLPGAKVGGRRLLVIPADKGYGPNGAGPIGPNETLIFVVDIIAVS